nr:uncharacterized protein LOC127301646 [Lolium perenne]
MVNGPGLHDTDCVGERILVARMGILLSCPADSYDPMEECILEPSASSGGLRALNSSKLLIQGSLSFKRAQLDDNYLSSLQRHEAGSQDEEREEERWLREAAYIFHGCLYIFYVWLFQPHCGGRGRVNVETRRTQVVIDLPLYASQHPIKLRNLSRACGGGEQRAQGTRARGSWNVFKEWSLRSVGWACRFTVGRHHIVDIFLTWLSRKPRAAGGGVKWCPAARTTGVRWVASALPVRCSHGGCRLGDACPRPSLDPRCRTPTGSSQAPWRWGCTTQAPQTMCEDWMRDLMHSLEGELSRCLDAKSLKIRCCVDYKCMGFLLPCLPLRCSSGTRWMALSLKVD